MIDGDDNGVDDDDLVMISVRAAIWTIYIALVGLGLALGALYGPY